MSYFMPPMIHPDIHLLRGWVLAPFVPHKSHLISSPLASTSTHRPVRPPTEAFQREIPTYAGHTRELRGGRDYCRE
jgi:hypothetical protein